MKTDTPYTHTHPPVPPQCARTHLGAGKGASGITTEERLKFVCLADLPQAKPVTRLYRRTREVGLIHRGRADYRVDLDRCRDAAALLGWIEHLSNKTWVKSSHIRELIEHAERENGIRIGRGA